MKNKEKYDLNTLKIEWTPQTAERRFFTIKVKRDESIIFSREMTSDENGTSAYNAWLEEEYVPDILTDKEKAYLSAVIKPFRKKVKCINKIDHDNINQITYIRIDMLNEDFASLPLFEKETMYKGMEVDKKYTLEDLGL